MGFSRKIPKTANFSLLTKESRHLIIHPRAIIENPDVYYKNRLKDPFVKKCPLEIESHDEPNLDILPEGNPMCTALLWESIMPSDEDETEKGSRKFVRKTVSASYRAGEQLSGTDFIPGIVMWLPITRIEIISDPIDMKHQELFEIISGSGTKLDVELVGE
jgi:hypothetical protein